MGAFSAVLFGLLPSELCNKRLRVKRYRAIDAPFENRKQCVNERLPAFVPEKCFHAVLNCSMSELSHVIQAFIVASRASVGETEKATNLHTIHSRNIRRTKARNLIPAGTEPTRRWANF